MKLILFLLFYSITSFSQGINISFSDAIFSADQIIRGKVLSTTSRWINDHRGNHIYTSAILRISESFKGEIKDSLINLELPGGKVNEISEEVFPSIILFVSDEVILFLKDKPTRLISNFYHLLVIESGKLKLPEGNFNIEIFKYLVQKILKNNEFDIEMHQISKKMSELFYLSCQNNDSITKEEKPINKIDILDNRSKFLLANITFFKPSDWSDKIVIANKIGQTVESKLYSTNNLFINWGIINNGISPSGKISTNLYLDGFLLLNSTFSGLNTGQTYLYKDILLGKLSVGEHKIKLVLDYDNNIQETDENDNEFIKNFNIYPPLNNPPLITKISPDIASAGTGLEVKIIGLNFGDSTGSNNVEYFYQDRLPKISATIKKWSDNEIICNVPVSEIYGYPASASSGPVTISTNNGTSNGYPFYVLFGTSNEKWLDNKKLIQFKINENCEQVLDEGKSIQVAAETWNSAKADFKFEYTGSTVSIVTSFNGINEIMFSDYDGVAKAVIWSVNSKIKEADIEFNKSLSWGTDVSNKKIDIQSTALHELGHLLCLRDLYGLSDKYKAMYGITTTGKINRILTTSDVAGIQYLFGAIEVPQIPNLKIPLNLATNLSKNISFEWNDSDGATSYQLQISNDLLFTEIVKDTSGLSNTTQNINLSSLNNIYFWRVRAYNSKGGSNWSNIWHFSTKNTSMISNLNNHIIMNLCDNYPNPFNPYTTIKYSLSKLSIVNLKILDVFGREVNTLVNKVQPEGSYIVEWRPNNIASGIYYYKIQTDTYANIKKMIYLK